ncbi:hypothetical protein TRP8649_02225 [Pelagimonas phthalicica]|uniref:Heme exporter protein D n=1 Tax=Pelagimonas phthalicica TaxID=1037362 RepID=A0A238JDS5_9RHOB|nr:MULTISPECIES: hypothetical protein [Roseobacteraceae]MBO9464841.1 hypothetical protein [Tropicibacter sp. R15_0]TDS91065.1 hypothetical protein CLV87_2227 [Pelagimonas phthalicica]SMX28112.1 hypothetical protein TRP8649_02225 [Pelagimonas phthalicica]
MTGLANYLNNVWPILACLAVLGVLTYGALTPYIRKERKRRLEEQQDD